MRSLFEPQARRDILDRLAQLGSDNRRRWGKMEIERVLPHVADQLRMALGDIPASPPRGPMRFAPIRYLTLHVLPWPKGKAQAPPEGFTTAPESWEADKAKVVDLIERFAQAPHHAFPPTNPLFGRMTGRDWAVLSYRHLDHHLRQFGA